MTRGVMKRILVLLSAAILAVSVGACGGTQGGGNNGGGGGGGGNNGGGGGGNGGGGDTGPTEEELEQMRLDAAANSFEQAGQLYDSALEGERNYGQIEELLMEALENDPDLAEAWFNIGRIRYEQGDVEGAIEAYETAGSMGENYARGLANIGYIRLMEGDVSGAEQLFLQCLEVSEVEPGCNINLAVMYRQQAIDTGDDTLLQTSIDHLRFALGGEANNADAYANLARAYFDQGRYELARLVCENAILQGIDDAVLHNRLGLIALADDDVIVAYAEFQEAVRQDPLYIDAHTNIGAMALSFRDYQAAVDSFGVVVEARPDDLGARLSHGVALRGAEDYRGAEAEYCAVLEADPNNLDAVYNLGLLFEEYERAHQIAIDFYSYFLTLPGGSTDERAEDMNRRVENLGLLIEFMIEDGVYEPPTIQPACPAP